MADISATQSSAQDCWETPQYLFDALNSEFRFTVDVCADINNRKVDKFFSVHQDAFRLQWTGVCYANPPYGRDIGRWMEKAKNSAIDHGSTVVVLCPARCDTNWWFDHARFGEVRLLKGRIKFIDPLKGIMSSAPFPSALIIYRPGMRRSTTYWHYRQVDYAPFYQFSCLD